MFNIICIVLFALSVFFLVGDFIIMQRNKRLVNDFTALKEWCAETGKNPDDFIKIFENIRKEVIKK